MTQNHIDERGQLILIGAVLLAVTIVGSIVLLNSIHESPDVYTQQESQSLEDAELVVEEVRGNLERVFLVNTSVDQADEPLPYAQEGNLEEIIEEYERQYTNLSTIHSSGLVQIEPMGGRTGAIARLGPGIQAFPNEVIMEDAAAIPRFELFVNDTSDPFTVRLSNGETFELQIDSTEVQLHYPDGSNVETCPVDDSNAITIEMSKGFGSVTTDETYCEIRAFGTSLNSASVEFLDGGNANGTFTITGVGASVPNHDPSLDPSSTSYLVNPKFEVRYRNPDLSYTSTFGLYNRSE